MKNLAETRAEDGQLLYEDTQELNLEQERGPWHLEVGAASAACALELRPGQRVVLGSGAQADLRVSDRTVSARHCVVRAHDTGLTVEDLDSTNGVYVGSARVKSAILTGAGASFVIGGATVTVRPPSFGDTGSVAPLEELVGSSLAMQRVVESLRNHARLSRPVLIQGESGTGKDVAARVLHRLSGRAGAYVPINVGAIPESLADAELFGHRRGAFTGAIQDRAGAFEQAHRGTLFLDEIAELPLAMQARLLRVVEDGVVRPVGGQPHAVDVRIVSASWALLDELVDLGRFRSDLYHRLSVMIIQIPPLRQRKTDLPALCQALLARHEWELGPRTLSSGALAKLVAYSFPGNVRELSSVLYRAAVAAAAPEIQARHIDAALPARSAGRSVALSPEAAHELLEQHRGNVSAAARSARVARSTFRAWLEKVR